MIWELAWFQECEANIVFLDTISIFTVVKDSNTIVRIRNITPFVSKYLNLSLIPTCIAMCVSVDEASLNIKGSLSSLNINWEVSFYKFLWLKPVNLGNEINTWSLWIENDSLSHLTYVWDSVGKVDWNLSYNTLFVSKLHEFRMWGSFELSKSLEGMMHNIPTIPEKWNIWMHCEHIKAFSFLT